MGAGYPARRLDARRGAERPPVRTPCKDGSPSPGPRPGPGCEARSASSDAVPAPTSLARTVWRQAVAQWISVGATAVSADAAAHSTTRGDQAVALAFENFDRTDEDWRADWTAASAEAKPYACTGDLPPFFTPGTIRPALRACHASRLALRLKGSRRRRPRLWLRGKLGACRGQDAGKKACEDPPLSAPKEAAEHP